MKTITLMLCLVLAATVAFAGTGKTELSIAGQAVNLKDGPTLYEVAGEALFPAGPGWFVIGPSVVLSDDDTLTRAGLAADVNLTSQKGGPFIGATAHYFLQTEEGLDNWTAVARAGFKIPVGSGACLKVFVAEPVGGRFHELADLSGNIGITAKF